MNGRFDDRSYGKDDPRRDPRTAAERQIGAAGAIIVSVL
jgi:hypothetical protein